MALVMLPCELPWWPSLQRHLKHLQLASTSQKIIDGFLKIHDMCNISLDPDEEEKDPNMMEHFYNFLENDLSVEERTHFMDETLPNIIRRALNLKHWKPKNGLVFSLQQHPDYMELSYDFLSSLLAHAFFSSYPKRTLKTHPTLQDFNFTNFFKNLHNPFQKAKLKSILYYFDWIENNNNEGFIKLSRQIMSSKQWLTIEDWIECSLPLCRMQFKHDGRMEECSTEGLNICFSNSRLGDNVLAEGSSQESIMMCTMPDILAIMLSVEALEDNEILRIEGARRFTRIVDPRSKCRQEILPSPQKVSVCCLDPENYTILPAAQYEEDNILRELNKCLLGFQQKPLKLPEPQPKISDRRLSPIGESFSNTPPEVEATVLIKQTSASTLNSVSSRTPSPDAYCSATINLNDPCMNIMRSKCHLTPDMNTLNNRRGRFIVLGSSGECLPVKRPLSEACDSVYSSCNSSFDEFHSANTSFDEGGGDENLQARQYSLELNTVDRRESFAQRLKDALRREIEDSLSESLSTDSSYAVGISVTGSGLHDRDIRLNRGGSGGFVLAEDSIDEDQMKTCNRNEQDWMTKLRSRRSPGLVRKNTNDSSKYSFSTEYSSELEEVYEQFSHWLDDPIVQGDTTKKKELDSRDLAVVKFASSLLKRTLSESFAGVPLTDGCFPIDRRAINKNKLVSSVRSLSLELARHKHRLAAQLNTADERIRNDVIEEMDENQEGSLENPVIVMRPSRRNSQTSTKSRKKKLNWIVNVITETIEQNIECEYVTVKIPKLQLSQLANKTTTTGYLLPVITGNWGCGKKKCADTQLKLIIQWLATSVAGAPSMIYYTFKNEHLCKLDTLYRVLIDRKWTVGQLTLATLKFAQQLLNEPHLIPDNNTLFDELIGIEKFGD